VPNEFNALRIQNAHEHIASRFIVALELRLRLAQGRPRSHTDADIESVLRANGLRDEIEHGRPIDFLARNRDPRIQQRSYFHPHSL
jgi:hypothetical protein